jgi:DNA (cytosine-5)-methyltransferase 1
MNQRKLELVKKYGMLPPVEKPWVTMRDAFEGIPDPIKYPDFDIEHVYRPGAKLYPGHTGSEIDEPSKTIKAGAHGVPGGENLIDFCDGNVRYLTVLEAKRIQTFPDDYRISGAWTESMRQLGNAVPVRLAQYIADSLFSVL